MWSQNYDSSLEQFKNVNIPVQKKKWIQNIKKYKNIYFNKKYLF